MIYKDYGEKMENTEKTVYDILHICDNAKFYKESEIENYLKGD